MLLNKVKFEEGGEGTGKKEELCGCGVVLEKTFKQNMKRRFKLC